MFAHEMRDLARQAFRDKAMRADPYPATVEDNMPRACSNTRSPICDNVEALPRWRSNKLQLSCFSSALICSLTETGVIDNCSAAARKLPASTTRTNTSNWRKVIGIMGADYAAKSHRAPL
jgi:hypothetical protein